jgi:hypothetical protein
VEVAGEVMRLLVGDVRDDVWLRVGDVDELELEIEWELELVLEVELVLLELSFVVLLALLEAPVLELSVPEVWLGASVEVGDSLDAGVAEELGTSVEVGRSVELGTVTVPSVVGAVRVFAVSVKLKVKLGRSRVSVIPVAVANTLVARSLAVPQPN